MMFGAGDFDAPMLVHDTKDVPGIEVFSKRRDHVRYIYGETPVGGRVNIITTDQDALRRSMRSYRCGALHIKAMQPAASGERSVTPSARSGFMPPGTP
jgi:hypothetical protein